MQVFNHFLNNADTWVLTDTRLASEAHSVITAHLGVWTKPSGKGWAFITLVGAGGNGGNGAIGANSLASGGGGGGGGTVAHGLFPLDVLPDCLFYNLAAQGSGTGAGSAQSLITTTPSTAGNSGLLFAPNGNPGGNASGATAGAGAGGAGVAAIAFVCPLIMLGSFGAFTGANAPAGGGVGLAGPQINSTAWFIGAGTGGAGLGAAGSNGAAGGDIFNGFSGLLPNVLQTNPGGLGTAAATTPPGRGNNGALFNYGAMPRFGGGTGGGATHGSATGAGLVQSSGGDGAPGCGGGGSGGALTGSTPGTPGKGGQAFCIIRCF